MQDLVATDHVAIEEPLKFSVVGRIVIPKDGHILIPRAYDYVTLISKRGSRLQIELRILHSLP